MNYTNIANLPEPLVSALKYSDYDKVGDISVSTLPLPPRIVQLTKRHSHEITEDVSNLLWRLIGSIGHKILERADTNNHLSEERLTMPCLGWVISGKPDLLGPDMVLSDYKFTSVWAIKDEKSDWVQQLNLYSLLYRQHGFEVKAARIIAVLRDWSKPKAAREPDYPQVGVVVREVPLWSPGYALGFMMGRVSVHQKAEKLTDDDLPMCTPDERWRKDEIWAAYKNGVAKRATKLFKSETEAHEYKAAGGDDRRSYRIEHRPGEDVRCLSYCAVRQFCNYGKNLKASNESEAA